MAERCCGTEPRIIRNEYDNNPAAFVCPVCGYSVRGSVSFWNDRIREREAAKWLIAEPSPLVDEEADVQAVCSHCGYAVREGETIHPVCRLAAERDAR